MAILKIGENLKFSTEDCILTPKQALHDKKIAARFIKLAKKLRRVAPKAADFLYGHAVMMHAAEACLVDQETGVILVDCKGKPVIASFEPHTLKNGKESVKWKCSKKDLMPYKNANGDIFPEAELIKSHKKWVGKPLCKDHKSESVDGIRGIIIDTYYDKVFKRVHALFALDRKNYGDLARKVETGYANAVSMGTAVGQSICTECANIAVTERDYCKCIKARSNYGEINIDLNPIELSLVVNGADGRARIRNIIASMNEYVQEKQARIEKLTADRCVNPTELQAIADSVNEMQIKLSGLMQTDFDKTAKIDESVAKTLAQLTSTYKELKQAGANDAADKIMERIKELANDTEQPVDKKTWPPMRPGPGGPSVSPMSGEGYEDITTTTPIATGPSQLLYASKKEGDKQESFSKELRLLRSKIDNLCGDVKKVLSAQRLLNDELYKRAKARRAYWIK